MSIWGDIQRRGMGVQKKKEDEIKDYSGLIFYGCIDDINELPTESHQGALYYINDLSCYAIYYDGKFDIVTAISQDSSENIISSNIISSVQGIPIYQENPITIQTETGTYETHIG